MIQDLTVKTGPQIYEFHEGAIDHIPDILQSYRTERVLIIHGDISWKKAKPYLKALIHSDNIIYYEQYGGECSYNEANRIAEIVHKNKIDFIIGVGAGKLSDLTLQVAAVSNRPYGLVATMASNCAPWTPLSVMYKDDGTSEGFSKHEDRQAVFLLLDPKLILDSPIRYYIAGVADTMAKWYESDLMLTQPRFQNEPFLLMARQATVLCRQTMLDISEKAIEDMKNGIVSEEFKQVAEIIIAISGLVGGFANKYARVTLAHAIHDSLAGNIDNIHQYTHGEIVAYGIFFQLAMENNWDEIKALIPFYKKLNLPKSLKDMNAFPIDEDTLDAVVDMTYKRDQIHVLPFEITRDSIKEGILTLESFIDELN